MKTFLTRNGFAHASVVSGWPWPCRGPSQQLPTSPERRLPSEGGRGPVRAYSHQVPYNARRLAIPAPADFGSQHDEALGSSSAQFFRAGGVFAAFGRAERCSVRLRGAGLGLTCAGEW